MRRSGVTYVRRGRGKAHVLHRRFLDVTVCGLTLAATSTGPWVELTEDDKERVPVCRTCIRLLGEWPSWVMS